MLNQGMLSQIKSLSPSEKLELIGVVWETLPVEEVPVSKEEKHLLDERLTYMEAHPDDRSSLEDVMRRLRRQLP